MDMGVDSFVFSLGLTSAAPHLDPNRPRESLWKATSKGFRKSIPVWILGVVRVFMVKGVEYPVSWLLFFRPSDQAVLNSKRMWTSLR